MATQTLPGIHLSSFHCTYLWHNKYSKRSGLLNRFVKYYDESLIEMPTDYLVGMTEVEAKVGQVQVGRYHDIIANRRKVAEFYHKNLQGIPNLILPPLVEGATYSHYVPRTEHRQELMQYALKHGVQLGQIIEYYIPKMAAYRDHLAIAFLVLLLRIWPKPQ